MSRWTRRSLSCGIVGAVLLTTGCSALDRSVSPPSGDCAPVVDFQGKFYWGVAAEAPTEAKIGRATEPKCDDMDPDGIGPIPGTQVGEPRTVWSIEGIDPSLAIVSINGNGERQVYYYRGEGPPPGELPKGLRERIKTVEGPAETDGYARGDAAVWRIAPKQHLSTSTTRFKALVTRLECNSGVTGKVLRPTVKASESTVVVTFAVSRDEDRAGDCQSNEWVPYQVNLGEPLGDRALVDGECLPGGEASTTTLCRRDGIRFEG